MCGRFKLQRSDKQILAAKFGLREVRGPDVDTADAWSASASWPMHSLRPPVRPSGVESPDPCPGSAASSELPVTATTRRCALADSDDCKICLIQFCRPWREIPASARSVRTRKPVAPPQSGRNASLSKLPFQPCFHFNTDRMLRKECLFRRY